MARKMRITKRVDKTVQTWMRDEVFEVGDVVYEFSGYTYGCVGSGIPVTRVPDELPFCEVPRDCVEPV